MLSPGTTWVRAAAAAAGEPRLLVELKPTVLYAEATREDWGDAESASNIDQEHPSGELRLAVADVVAVRQSTAQMLTDVAGNRYVFHYNKAAEANADSSALDRYDEIGQFIQTVTVNQGFRLSKLRIGARATDWMGDSSKGEAFKSNLIFRLMGDLREGDALSVRGLYDKAHEIWRGEANYGGHNVEPATVSDKGTYLEFDLSGAYVYVPGGGRLHALDIRADTWLGAQYLALYGAQSGGYNGGQLYQHDHQQGISRGLGSDLFFELVAEGFAASGTAVYELDLGAAPSDGLAGELELKYVTPGSSAISFRFRESSNSLGWTSWAACTDGTALNGYRYVQVEATLSADSNRLITPRVLSIRAAYKRSDKFMLAQDGESGYPKSVFNAPGFSAEGDPLEGKCSMSDTSPVVIADPDGMLADNLLAGFNVKNDEVVFSIGFAGMSLSDYLRVKTLWIENWIPNDDGTVTLLCYDQQARFKNIEIPSAYDGDPALSEQIHFDGTLPGTIKSELLQRAGVRLSQINATSLAALSAGFAWSLVHGVKKQTKAQEICAELNRHLLSFEYIDETGKWASPYVDFAASPAATITQDDIIAGSEEFDPGWDRMKNVAAVFFDGEGDNEADYRKVALLTDSTSMKGFKEAAADRLLSEWIPQDDDPGAITGISSVIAIRRAGLQASGIRTVSFVTSLAQAHLQLGDHIYYHSARYARPGASSPNPLTCFITRKNFSADLKTVSWSALVLLDAEQSAPGAAAVAAPSALTITDNADRTADLAWTASADDNGTVIKRYEIFVRRKGMKNWGSFRTYTAADGSASYAVAGLELPDAGYYDFGVRAVHKNRRVSQMATALAENITETRLAAPTWLLVPVAGGWQFRITVHVSGALFYRVYKYAGPARGWEALPESVGVNKKVKQSTEPLVSAALLAGHGAEYGRFKLATVNAGGTGELSAEQAGWSLPFQGTLLAATLAPALPDEAGTYPLLVQVQNQSGEYKWAVTLKITAPSGYEDMVSRYEIERRDNGTGSYGSWELVGTRKVENYPAPATLLWTNHDARLKPGVTYQWRVRAIAPDGSASAYSDSLTEAVAYPTTPLDKPTVTVVATALGLIGQISTPLRGGLSINERFYYKIEVYDGAWSTWDVHYPGQVFLYPPVEAKAATNHQFRVTAYDQHDNPSTVSTATTAKKINLVTNAVIAAGTVLASNVAFTFGDVDSATIVAQLNASAEGLRITTSLLQIDGSVSFSAGYNPTDKVAALAGSYNSAASGARVRIFPDSNTGILVTDGTNDVFKVLVGGTDVGDVIIGNAAGQFVKWDKSAGTLIVAGMIDTTAGIKTGTSGERIVISGTGNAHALQIYDSDGDQTVIMAYYGFLYVDSSSRWVMCGDLTQDPHPNGAFISGTTISVYASNALVIAINTSGLQVGASTVIDTSKNIANVGTITCSGVIDGGSYIDAYSGFKINGTVVLAGRMAYCSTFGDLQTALIGAGLMAAP